MKKDKLEKYLGKYVKIVLFDNDIISGYLEKTGDEKFKDNLNLYIPQNYYFLMLIKSPIIENSYLFRSSHVKKLTEIK